MNEILPKTKHRIEDGASELAAKGATFQHGAGRQPPKDAVVHPTAEAAKNGAGGKAKPALADVATQSDLVELHKRIVALFSTLNKGLSETAMAKAAQDRAELSARIDSMEEAVNSMEGVLRIELAPHIRAVFHEEMEDQRRLAKPSFWTWVMRAGLAVGLVLGGAFFTEEIQSLLELIRGYVAQAEAYLFTG